MFEFEKLCREVEKIDPLTYSVVITEKTREVIEGLSLVTMGGLSGLTIYAGLILGAVVSDGKISEEEYLIIEPFLSIALGGEVSYEEVKLMLKYFRQDTEDYKKFISAVIKLFGEISDDLKTDMITVCLLVCGIDGKISLKERLWLKKLIKE